MIRGVNAAAAGMLATERLEQTMTNDLANAQTPGFKTSNGSMMAFPEQLQYAMNYNGVASTQNPIGWMGQGVDFQEGVPSFLQGTLSTTNRALDVALVDTTPAGTYASVANGNSAKSVQGTVTANAAGQLSINGTPLAVLDPLGTPIQGTFAAKNPNYQGTLLYGADGKPNYDANGQPSYVFVDANNQFVGSPANPQFQGMAVRIGSNTDMGEHSFFPVAYQSLQGDQGIAVTKDGHFGINSQNELVDAAGNAILPVDANGQVLSGYRIVANGAYIGDSIFASNGQPLNDANGQPSYSVVNAAGNTVAGAHLGSVNVDVSKVSPLGESEFMVGGTFAPAQVMANLTVGTGQINPGKLEESNVDVNAIMTKMMTATQVYQANQQVLSVLNTTLGDAVQKVGVDNL